MALHFHEPTSNPLTLLAYARNLGRLPPSAFRLLSSMNRFGFVILVAWLGLTLIFLNTLVAPQAWNNWPPDYCRRANCYCEPLYLDRLIAQPLATYSNLGFVGVGLAILWLTLRRAPLPNNPFTHHRSYPVIYALALTTTGLFSFFYHASLTKLGDYLDLIGVYLFTSFLLLYNLNRLRSFKPSAFAGSYVTLNLALGFGLYMAYGLQQIYFAALILSTLAIEILIQRRQRPVSDLRLLVAALTLFGLGATVWVLDSNGGLPCWPSAPVTWHALWHLAAAAAAGVMYLYYRSARAA